YVVIARKDVLSHGALLDVQLALGIEHQNIRTPVWQALRAHLAARGRTHNVVVLINDDDDLIRWAHTSSLDSVRRYQKILQKYLAGHHTTRVDTLYQLAVFLRRG